MQSHRMTPRGNAKAWDRTGQFAGPSGSALRGVTFTGGTGQGRVDIEIAEAGVHRRLHSLEANASWVRALAEAWMAGYIDGTQAHAREAIRPMKKQRAGKKKPT